MSKLDQQHKRDQFHRSRMQYLNTHWPAWVTLFVAALLYEALPTMFYWGPRGLMIGLVTLLTIALIITYWRRNIRSNRILSLMINILITLYMIISVSRLVLAVFQGHIGPAHLLASALTLWATNILVFALWYWNLDAGGPNEREANEHARIAAFLFPQTQIALTQGSHIPPWIKNWEPVFIDYLFLAFNTSTAFSPTDTPVLSRWAKCLSMIQALISLMIIVMLAARAINILNPTTNYLVS